jgi:hypothetical protein
MQAKFLSEKLTVRDHSKDLGVDGKIILECILGKQSGKLRAGFNWLRTEAGGGPL